MQKQYFDIADELTDGLRAGRPVVALESTIIAHGLPWPDNLDCACRLQAAVRDRGALPATVAVLDGRIKIGLSEKELNRVARADDVTKVSRRDLASVVRRGGAGATTVAATMICAHLAGIRVFATGGIGGVHRGAELNFDVSADLIELARTPVAVVCAGAKSILDLPKTLEVLETHGVPVLGYQTERLPAFYVRDSGLTLSDRVDSAVEAAQLIVTRDRLGLGGGEVFAVPIPAAAALPAAEVDGWIVTALSDAERAGVVGKASTPFLLARMAELSGGRTLAANLALVEHNATVAAEIAVALAEQHR